MIFTGVTGGEIVSLLYPLFILSPFCYIIISKESLDGDSSDGDRHGSDESAGKSGGRPEAFFGGCGGGDDFLWRVYRQQRFHTPGGDHVFAVCGCEDHRENL